MCTLTHTVPMRACVATAKEGLSRGSGGYPGLSGRWWFPWQREESGKVWRVSAGLL